MKYSYQGLQPAAISASLVCGVERRAVGIGAHARANMLLPTSPVADLSLHPLLLHQHSSRAPTVLQMAAADTEDPSRDVVAVALPILGACLAEPVLSMIDTACVGRLAGSGASVGLAALNVNAAIFNMIACCTSFLCTASTAVVATVAADADDDCETERSACEVSAGRAFRDGMLISLALGTAITIGTLLHCHTILSQGFGLSPTSAAYKPALAYLQIRALSMPAVCATLVGAGVSLGLQDAITPVLAVIFAFSVNVVGDLLCVWHLEMGLAGAAIATASASWASALLVGGMLTRRLRPQWRRPVVPHELVPFVTCSGALILGTALNAATYTSSSRVVAVRGVVAEAAAHQIGLQGWWLLSFVSVPLSLAGQSLLPQRSKQRPRLAALTVRTLTKFGTGCAVLMSASNALLTTHLAPMFSTDAAVLAPLRAITHSAVASQACITLATALDGVYIGCGRLRHYVATCGLGTAAALALMARSLRTGGGIEAAWCGLLAFSALRVVSHLLCLPRLLAALDLCAASKNAHMNREGSGTDDLF